MADIMDKMIGLFIGAVLAGALIPTALTNIFSAPNQTAWSVEVQALWLVVGIAVVIAIVVAFFKLVK